MRRWRLVLLSPIFGGQEAKMSNTSHNKRWSPWIAPSKTINRFEIDRTIIKKSRPKHDQNWHVCAISCRPEVDCDVISSRNVKTIVGYIVANFKLLALVVSEIFKNIISWWRWRQRWTSTIALSENALLFRLKIQSIVTYKSLLKFEKGTFWRPCLGVKGT